ncbi:MAG TPA: hypothetical protein ENH32_07345 [Proteobacteria bacterium]|nr:hypothetical protein BMS3Abin14_02101 [bacterium BMS3Abin14]HDL53774.1 hypothetical protein [Pseudomonadota bacterium]
MARITLFAQSDAEEPFEVVFTREDGKLTIRCNCPEGISDRICEHKTRLASNDYLMLANPGEMRELMEAHLWVIQSPVSDLLLRLFDLQRDDKQDDRLREKIEHEIALAMKEGSLIDSP